MIEEEVMEIKQEKMNAKEEAIVMELKEDQGEEEKTLSLVTNFRILILSQINILWQHHQLSQEKFVLESVQWNDFNIFFRFFQVLI